MMQPLPETLRVQLHPARSAPFFCWMPGPHQTACVIDIGLTGCQVSKKWIQVPFVYDASVGELLCVRLAAARPVSFAGSLETQFCLATVVCSSVTRGYVSYPTCEWHHVFTSHLAASNINNPSQQSARLSRSSLPVGFIPCGGRARIQ